MLSLLHLKRLISSKQLLSLFNMRRLIRPISLLPIKLSNEYEIRLLKESDQTAINEICSDVYGGNDFLPYNFHRFLLNKKCLCAGIEYKPQSKIVGTRILKIIDGGITALGIGARMAAQHRNKKIFSQFREWENQFIKELYPNIQRIRGATYSSNVVSLHIGRKQGQVIIEGLPSFIWSHIEYSIDEKSQFHGEHVIKPKQMQLLLDETGIDGIDNEEYIEIRNAEYIAVLLRDILLKKTLYIDLQIYDLSIGRESIMDIEEYLIEEIESNRLTVWMNKDKTTLGMVYIDERPYLTQLYIYGRKQNELDALLMMNKLFKKWKTESDKLINREYQSCWLFIDEEVVYGYPILNKLCHGFDTVSFTELKDLKVNI